MSAFRLVLQLQVFSPICSQCSPPTGLLTCASPHREISVRLHYNSKSIHPIVDGVHLEKPDNANVSDSRLLCGSLCKHAGAMIWRDSHKSIYRFSFRVKLIGKRQAIGPGVVIRTSQNSAVTSTAFFSNTTLHGSGGITPSSHPVAHRDRLTSNVQLFPTTH